MNTRVHWLEINDEANRVEGAPDSTATLRCVWDTNLGDILNAPFRQGACLTFALAGNLLVKAQGDHKEVEEVSRVSEELSAKRGQQHDHLYREKYDREPRERLCRCFFQRVDTEREGGGERGKCELMCGCTTST